MKRIKLSRPSNKISEIDPVKLINNLERAQANELNYPGNALSAIKRSGKLLRIHVHAQKQGSKTVAVELCLCYRDTHYMIWSNQYRHGITKA